MYKTYSMVISSLREKIDAPSVDVSEIIVLIKKSYEVVSKQPTEVSKKLHNKLLSILLHQQPELQALLEGYYWPADSAEELERQFAIDPSNFSVVFRLAVVYSESGKHKRAKQLLSRVTRSEYKEKDLALKFLKERYRDEC